MKTFSGCINDQIQYLRGTGIEVNQEILKEELAFEILNKCNTYPALQMSFDTTHIDKASEIERTNNFQFFFLGDYIIVVNKYFK